VSKEAYYESLKVQSREPSYQVKPDKTVHRFLLKNFAATIEKMNLQGLDNPLLRF